MTKVTTEFNGEKLVFETKAKWYQHEARECIKLSFAYGMFKDYLEQFIPECKMTREEYNRIIHDMQMEQLALI